MVARANVWMRDNDPEADVVYDVLGLLTPREKHLLKIRFFDKMTQAQIALIFKVSQQAIQAAISNAIDKIEPHRDLVKSFLSQTNDPYLLAVRESLENL